MARPEAFQRDVLALVRTAVGADRPLALHLALTVDGRSGFRHTTWYESEAARGELDLLIPPSA